MRTQYNVDKMFTYLRGYLIGAKMEESLKALQFAREKHAGQTRKGGEPYIVHPLRMACYAVALDIRNDNIIATILLHDVVEDCGVMISNLPFNDSIKTGVKYMTVAPLAGEDKADTKRRYFQQLLESKEAIVCKALDRYDNLSSMAGVLSEDAVRKNVIETNDLLLPVLKEAKEKWVDLSNILFILRTNIRNINDTLYAIYFADTEKA
jgi:GTP pyrophosphokinase